MIINIQQDSNIRPGGYGPGGGPFPGSGSRPPTRGFGDGGPPNNSYSSSANSTNGTNSTTSTNSTNITNSTNSKTNKNDYNNHLLNN